MSDPIETPKASRKHSVSDRVEGILPIDRKDGSPTLSVADLKAFIADAEKEGVTELHFNFEPMGRWPVGLIFLKEAARS